jgi:hypothetical protein
MAHMSQGKLWNCFIITIKNRISIYVWRPSDKEKKRRSTKEKVEKPTPKQMEQAWKCLYTLAANDGDKL